jgi:hypothetical protein
MPAPRGRLYWIATTVGALVMLAACRGTNPEQATTPGASSPPAATPSPTTPSPSAPSQPPPATTPPPAQQAPSVSHGPDDTPIVISDGSLWIGLNPLGGKGSGGKQISFTNFDHQPGDPNEVRAITLMDPPDGTRFAWDGIDINGTAPSTCQNPAEDCLIQLQYEGPGMDVEVSWGVTDSYNPPRRRLTFRFPGRPVNQWIDWVHNSHIIFHPVDWDHSARKKFTQVFLNRNPNPVDPNGTRITIHLKSEPRQ